MVPSKPMKKLLKLLKVFFLLTTSVFNQQLMKDWKKRKNIMKKEKEEDSKELNEKQKERKRKG